MSSLTQSLLHGMSIGSDKMFADIFPSRFVTNPILPHPITVQLFHLKVSIC
jgi:hypothetical protein